MMKKLSNKSFSSKLSLASVTILISIIIIIIGYFYLQTVSERIHEQKNAELSAIAELKVNQITQWITERNSEAKFFSDNATYIENTIKLINDNQNRDAKESLHKGLSHIQVRHGYENIFVVSAEKNVLFTLNANENELGKNTVKLIDSSITTNNIVFSDFYLCDLSGIYHLDIIAPIRVGNEIIGVMLFRFDPRSYLYPLIQTWPLPSKTSETLLVREVEDSVEFITELRHIENKPHSLKISLNEKEVPAVQAVLGYRGIWEGIDYRGEKVVADIRPIANTNWLMIAKVDNDEILSELYSSYAYVILFSFFIILFISALAAFIYAYRQRETYRSLWQSQEELRLSEERFRVSQEMSPDGFTILHPERNEKGEIFDFTWVYENQTVARTNETDPEKIVGKRLLEIFPSHKGTSVFDAYLSVANTGKPEILEEVYVGEIISKPTWLRIVVVSMGDDIVILSQDITERKQTETELIHQKDLMHYVIEHANSAIAVHDRDLRYIYVSDRYLEQYGIKEKNILGKHHYEVFPDLPQKWRDVHQKVLKGEIHSSEKDPYENENGKIEWTRWECRPWYENDGSIGGIIVYTEVITDRINEEQNLIQSEKRFKSIVEGAPDPIFIQTDMKFAYLNPAACELFGINDPDELIGKPVMERFHPDYYEIIKNRISRLNDMQKPVEELLEQKFIRVDGSEVWVETAGEPINYEGKNGGLVFVRDITERKIAENTLEKLKNNLEIEVKQKTEELQQRVSELERFHEATIDRELRMKELREEIKRLKGEM